MSDKGKPWQHTKPHYSPAMIQQLAAANLDAARFILSHPQHYTAIQIEWSRRIVARSEPGSTESIVKRV